MRRINLSAWRWLRARRKHKLEIALRKLDAKFLEDDIKIHFVILPPGGGRERRLASSPSKDGVILVLIHIFLSGSLPRFETPVGKNRGGTWRNVSEFGRPLIRIAVPSSHDEAISPRPALMIINE